jgi:hypothetical protein
MAMTRSAMYQIRIDEMEKQETFAVFRVNLNKRQKSSVGF